MQYACKILNQKGTLNGLIFAWINFCVVTILGGILLILLIRKIKSTWNIEIHQFVKVDALVNLFFKETSLQNLAFTKSVQKNGNCFLILKHCTKNVTNSQKQIYSQSPKLAIHGNKSTKNAQKAISWKSFHAKINSTENPSTRKLIQKSLWPAYLL